MNEFTACCLLQEEDPNQLKEHLSFLKTLDSSSLLAPHPWTREQSIVDASQFEKGGFMSYFYSVHRRVDENNIFTVC